MSEQKNTINNKPEFKPGNTPYLQFGNELLNGDVNWQITLMELLLYTDYTIATLAVCLEVDEVVLVNLMRDADEVGFGFKTGARMLTMHEVAKLARDKGKLGT